MNSLIPEPGLVISYSYLWRHEYAKGKEEGRKIRPCVIILAVEKKDHEIIVTVAPITHTNPDKQTYAVEIPYKVKEFLHLNQERSWVILNEVNQFVWPGYDIYPVPGSIKKYHYVFLPPRLFDKIKHGVLNLIMARRTSIIKRV